MPADSRAVSMVACLVCSGAFIGKNGKSGSDSKPKRTRMVISPLSRSSDVTLLETFQAEQLIHGWRDEYNIDITDELHGHKQIYLYECNKSKLRFFVPSDVVGSERLYQQLEKNYNHYFSTKWEFEAAIRDLSDCASALEIGCGEGVFLDLLSKRNSKIRSEGVDINPKAIAVAAGKGFCVSLVRVEDLVKTKRDYFDAVVASHVLEHVPDPRAFLDAMINLVKPGGKIIIAVPNQASYLKHSKNALLNQPPHHMSQWSIETFRFLESIFPVRIRHFRIDPISKEEIDIYGIIQTHRFSVKILRTIFYTFFTRFLKPLLMNFPAVRALIPGENLYVCLEKRNQST